MPDTAAPSLSPDTRPPRELRRVVAADAPERRLPLHATMVPVFLRFDPTHDLPHIVETEKGHIIARFEKDADLAWFIRRKNDDRTTLPEAYVFQLTGGQL
ncbi:hypothetical protein [Reyranella sp.]|uniref:hypothetical protein n=1 Tax=Reyranella sp. TaxID=1929291 RepID=UPI003C7AB546